MKSGFLKNIESVLITGGTGTFGKAFARELLTSHQNIKRIVILSRDEFKHFEMQNDPFFRQHEQKIRYFIGDVREKERLLMAMRNIDLVIHAAALKQVPICEYNPFEAIKTNVVGAMNIIEASIANKVKKVIALSTDKASSPINLYGATKLCSDKLFVAGNGYSGKENTIFSVVRYGNVIGSRGSVIPFFKNLLNNGVKSLPITDERMTRFWLSLKDAVQMVIDCIELSYGGELFVKKIPSIRVVDLIEAMSPGIEHNVIGIRPGEKLHETMISKDDARTTIEFEKYYIILPQISFSHSQTQYKKVDFVREDFEYTSLLNEHFLSVQEIRDLL